MMLLVTIILNVGTPTNNARHFVGYCRGVISLTSKAQLLVMEVGVATVVMSDVSGVESFGD